MPIWNENGRQNRPGRLKNVANRPPQDARYCFETLFQSFLIAPGAIWGPFGSILGPFGSIFGTFWNPFYALGGILGTLAAKKPSRVKKDTPQIPPNLPKLEENGVFFEAFFEQISV